MTTKHLAILTTVVAIGMSGVFLLPRSAAQPFGVKLELPSAIGDWWGTDEKVTDKEKTTLGESTKFARKSYKNDWLAKPLAGYSLQVSIVLSGHDMSNSIHRPERCLDAQGWTVLGSEVVNINVPGKGSFPATRLQNRREYIKDGKKMEKEGKPVYQNAYSYYWFIGEKEITSSHWGRYFHDYSDRLLHGVNQRWAFVTVTGNVSVGLNAEPDPRLSTEVDRTLRKFISELAPIIHTDTLSYSQ